MQYYLAGGAVRNLLLGEAPADNDYAFSGSEEEFIAANPGARKLGAGPAFLLDGAEYSQLRGSPAEDLYARDFTVNCFLMEDNGVVHMHPRALADLRARLLVPATPTALTADPLRVFRAARFCAVFPDFKPTEECLGLMREAAGRETFRAIAPERVGRECLKALTGLKPGNFLRLLGQTGALDYWLRELAGAESIPAGPSEFHKTDVLEHIAQVMDKTELEFETWKASPGNGGKNTGEIRLLTAWMSLCHDLGKTGTPEDILPHHYQHEVRGMLAASGLAKRLRLSERLRKAGILAAKLHMKAGIYPSLRPATRVDLLMEAHSARLLTPLFLLAQADSGNAALLAAAARDLELVLGVRLPPKWLNRGKDSGKILRELRCQKLA
ncbi:MAG: hypothetical protein LBM64_01400 [Deltaproteobacteria bacterium]|jgi:tRNA nucleotidyltransferase (CCA-adding enzyme)|nr:hypothetical protein [Deltaproteobacteria bacterium]